MLKRRLKAGNTGEGEHENSKKMPTGIHASTVTSNVNGVNAPTKTHRLAEWLRKQDPYISCLQETYFRPRDICGLKVRGWKKIYHANGNWKKAGVTILIADKIDLNIKDITKNNRTLDDDQGINPRRHSNCKFDNATTVSDMIPNVSV